MVRALFGMLDLRDPITSLASDGDPVTSLLLSSAACCAREREGERESVCVCACACPQLGQGHS